MGDADRDLETLALIVRRSCGALVLLEHAIQALASSGMSEELVAAMFRALARRTAMLFSGAPGTVTITQAWGVTSGGERPADPV